MAAIVYTVAAILPDQGMAREYSKWLLEGHVDEVVKAGAHSAMVVRVTDPDAPLRIEARYVFPNRETFEAYVQHHAPALRAEGLRRFPPARGIRFERQVGEVL
jgi:hypothetical protein